MKFKSFFSGFLYGFFSMFLIPLLLTMINHALKLPVLQNIILQIIGAFLVFTGFIILIYCTRLFTNVGKGSPWPFDPPKKLVTNGIYQYSRNPQFVASAFIWFGEFFLFGSFLLFFYSLAWVIFNHLQLVLQDEKLLTKRFGTDYLHYKERVSRYIPGLFL